jgi:transposase
MGIDEIWLGKRTKFLTVVSNLHTGEPIWFGPGRTQATIDEFFRTELSRGQRQRIESACLDMWVPFTTSVHAWAPACRIVYDKFHVMQHANAAVDEVRRAEFFRKGGAARRLVKGKRWLLLSRWVHLDASKRQIGCHRRPAAEVAVAGTDTTVDHIGVDTRPCVAVRVAPAQWEVALVDAVQA